MLPRFLPIWDDVVSLLSVLGLLCNLGTLKNTPPGPCVPSRNHLKWILCSSSVLSKEFTLQFPFSGWGLALKAHFLSPTMKCEFFVSNHVWFLGPHGEQVPLITLLFLSTLLIFFQVFLLYLLLPHRVNFYSIEVDLTQAFVTVIDSRLAHPFREFLCWENEIYGCIKDKSYSWMITGNPK